MLGSYDCKIYEDQSRANTIAITRYSHEGQ